MVLEVKTGIVDFPNFSCSPALACRHCKLPSCLQMLPRDIPQNVKAQTRRWWLTILTKNPKTGKRRDGQTQGLKHS